MSGKPPRDSLKTCPGQCVKAEHGLPQGLTVPLPVPASCGGAISLDFMELLRPGQVFKLSRGGLPDIISLMQIYPPLLIQ